MMHFLGGGWEGVMRKDRITLLVGMLATQGPHVAKSQSEIVELAASFVTEIERHECAVAANKEKEREAANARERLTRVKISKLIEEDWMLKEIDSMIQSGNYLYKTLCARIQEFESISKPSKSVKDTIAHLRKQRYELSARNQDLTNRRHNYKGKLAKKLCEKHGLDFHRFYYE